MRRRTDKPAHILRNSCRPRAPTRRSAGHSSDALFLIPVLHKILLTVPNLDPGSSPWRELMGLVTHLPADRFRLTVCSLRSEGVEETAPLLKEVGVDCFIARFRPRGVGLCGLWGCFQDIRAIRGHGPFALQHSMDFTSSPFEALLSRRCARRFIFNQRNMNRNGHRSLLTAKARLARKIICISDAAQHYMQTLVGPEKLVKIHPGLEVARVNYREPALAKQSPIRLLMVGHITRLKRLEDGLTVLARLVGDFPGLRLDLAGRVVDSGYLEELKSLVQSQGLAARVSFLGPRSDILEVMRHSDLLLHTSGSEAFGMAIIEAMAVGLPVIAPDLEGPREIVEHQSSGLLVPPGDLSGYEQALRLLLGNPELGVQLAQNARRRVETCFSARRMAEQTAAVYASLCS